MKMEMCVNLWVNNTGGGGRGGKLVSLRSEHIGLSFFLLFWSTEGCVYC